MTWTIEPQPAGPDGPMIPILQVIILQDAPGSDEQWFKWVQRKRDRHGDDDKR